MIAKLMRLRLPPITSSTLGVSVCHSSRSDVLLINPVSGLNRCHCPSCHTCTSSTSDCLRRPSSRVSASTRRAGTFDSASRSLNSVGSAKRSSSSATFWSCGTTVISRISCWASVSASAERGPTALTIACAAVAYGSSSRTGSHRGFGLRVANLVRVRHQFDFVVEGLFAGHVALRPAGATLAVALFDDEAVSGRHRVFVDDAIVRLVRRQTEDRLYRHAVAPEVDLRLDLPDRFLRAGQERNVEFHVAEERARQPRHGEQQHEEQERTSLRHGEGLSPSVASALTRGCT